MIELNDNNFNDEVLEYKGKVVVDVWANWCGVCKMMKSKFEELSTTHTDYKFCTLNVDEAPKTASELNISNVPVFIIYNDGKEVSRGGFEVLGGL